MTEFRQIILAIVNDYKIILKRHMPRDAYKVEAASLTLNMRQVKNMSDVLLFELLKKIINHLEHYRTKAQKRESLYVGMNDFLIHLKDIAAAYAIEDGLVVHVKRKASHDLVEVIQLIALPVEHITEEIQERLRKCAYTVSQYGTKEQIAIAKKALRKHEHKLGKYFDDLFHELHQLITKVSIS